MSLFVNHRDRLYFEGRESYQHHEKFNPYDRKTKEFDEWLFGYADGVRYDDERCDYELEIIE